MKITLPENWKEVAGLNEAASSSIVREFAKWIKSRSSVPCAGWSISDTDVELGDQSQTIIVHLVKGAKQMQLQLTAMIRED